MSSPNLFQLLEDRHCGDFYVPECRMGSSGSRLLDGWALLPTWSPLTTIGYEIKNTRSDWIRDQKFMEYRPACHLLVVVAQKGLISKSELPIGVGLLEPAGPRLVMKVKPARQEPDHKALNRLMAYVLMWRVKVDRGRGVSRERRADVWREFAAQRKDFRAIGSQVKGRMRAVLAEALDRATTAERRLNELAAAEAVLSEMGVRLGSWNIRREIIQRLADAGGADITRDLDAAIVALARVRESFRSANNPPTQNVN